MNRVLVTYATMSGSTAEVAQAVADELAQSDFQVDVLPLAEVERVDEYDGIVVGGPMIMGWHRAAKRFLKKHRQTLRHTPLAVFVTAISVTETGETSVDGVPVQLDPDLPKPPADPQRLTFRERYARLPNYIRPILKAARPAEPVRVGVFGGRLEYGRLPWWGVLFVMFIIRASAGERRNWDTIRAWAAELPAAFAGESAPEFETR